jgi:hypothetical protein
MLSAHIASKHKEIDFMEIDNLVKAVLEQKLPLLII